MGIPYDIAERGNHSLNGCARFRRVFVAMVNPSVG
jgi:hypothetical protein